MVKEYENTCPTCGGKLKYFDKVRRMTKNAGGTITWIYLSRLKCCGCNSKHRVIPDSIYPYKHYKAHIINGVRNGTINPYMLEYEDYPCEMTMKRWKNMTV